jgi:hypothetical protein
MLATLVESAHHSQHVLVIAMLLMFVCLGVVSTFSDKPSGLVAPFMALAMMGVVMFIWLGIFRPVAVMRLIIGEEKSENKKPKPLISPETWKYIGLVVGAIVCLAVIAAMAYFIAKKFFAWYNSPAKIEARAMRKSEFYQRMQNSLMGEPDYTTLCALKAQLGKRNTPEATALLAEIDRLLENVRRDAEATALQPIAEELAQIRFRHDSAEPEEAGDPGSSQ